MCLVASQRPWRYLRDRQSSTMTSKRKAAAGSSAAIADDNDGQSAKRRKLEVRRIVLECYRIRSVWAGRCCCEVKEVQSKRHYISLVARLERTHELVLFGTSSCNCITKLLHPAMHSFDHTTTAHNTPVMTNLCLSKGPERGDARGHDSNWSSIPRGTEGRSRQTVVLQSSAHHTSTDHLCRNHLIATHFLELPVKVRYWETLTHQGILAKETPIYRRTSPSTINRLVFPSLLT